MGKCQSLIWERAARRAARKKLISDVVPIFVAVLINYDVVIRFCAHANDFSVETFHERGET